MQRVAWLLTLVSLTSAGCGGGEQAGEDAARSDASDAAVTRDSGAGGDAGRSQEPDAAAGAASGAPDATADDASSSDDATMRASDSGRAASGDAVSDAAAACPVFGDPEQVGTVVHPDLNEISGMAASRTQTGIVWVHNDSGDIARVFAMRTTGSHLGTFTLTGIAATDWEDISMGPGPGGVDHIYVGDIGDNQGTRSVVVVHRFAEPLVVPGPIPQDDPVTAVDSFTLAYDDGSHPDAEAMFVHPTLGDVYVLTKTDDGMSGLFRARAPLDAPGTVLERVGTVDFSDGATASSRQVTAADITVAGDRVIARTRDRALVWDTRRDIVEALTNPGCPAPIAVEVQGEAIAWTSEGDGYLTTSEVTNQPIWHVALVK